MNSKEKALALARAATEKKGLDIRVLDLRGVSGFTDFFVIASGTSSRHARTVAESVLEAAGRLGDKPIGVEGLEASTWILVDLGDVVVHVFRHDVREFYSLERLWGEADRVELTRVAGGLG